MATADLYLGLSPLAALGPFLVQRAQSNEELQAALDDGLEDYTQGAELILAALEALLDEWLVGGQEALYRTNQALDPFRWLAINDHLAVVQAFRNLL